MKKINKILDSEISVISFTNEAKGLLFEYLVAFYFSLSQADSKNFLTVESLPQVLKKRLEDYESFLRQYNLELLKKLDNYARQMAEYLREYLEKRGYLGRKDDFQICLEKEKKSWREADFFIYSYGPLDGTLKKIKQEIPIGLKLTQQGAWVNTKSGGMQSFFTTYFSNFSDSTEIQKKINQESALHHKVMQEKLLEFHRGESPTEETTGWEWEKDFYSEEKIKKEIKEETQISQLPGQLPKELKKIVLSYYEFLTFLLSSHLQELYKQSPAKFLENLLPLMGFSRPDLWRVMALVSRSQQELSFNISHGKDILLKENNLLFIPKKHSLEIQLEENCLLQIRPKPMRSYLTPSFKINCSLKIS